MVEYTSREYTSHQQEIYNLYYIDCQSVKEIAKSRQISVQAVYKTLRKIGGCASNNHRGFKIPMYQFFKPPTYPIKRYWRLHGCEFNIHILWKSDFYEKRQREKGNLYYLDGQTIRLYRNSIEVYQGKDKELSFIGETIEEVSSQEVEYFNALFKEIEKKLQIIIVKGENTRIKMVKSGHYAEVNNELAKEYNSKRQKIQIRAKDNKIWFEIDHSFNMDEAEFKHPETSKEDAEKLNRYWQDIREKPSYLPSENARFISDLIERQTENAIITKGILKAIDLLRETIEGK